MSFFIVITLNLFFFFRTSALRSSQNSLQSSVANSQRPSSAYYPPPVAPNASRSNLHQSIPNLKSPPTTHRLHNDDARSGSYPSVNHNQNYGQNYNTYHGGNSAYMNQNYPNYHGKNEDKPPFSPQYAMQNNSYPSPTTPTTPNYTNNVQQPLHINANGQRQEDTRYSNTGGGLLREDVFRQSQNSRHEELMRYPSTNNVRISEAQIQQSRVSDDMNRQNEMRTSKSEDMLKHHALNPGDMMRYASSGNIRQDTTKMMTNEERQMRGQAKMAEMGEEVRRRQNRLVSPNYPQSPQHMPNSPNYYAAQQQTQYFNQQGYGAQMAQNAQSMQNLSLSQVTFYLFRFVRCD